MMIAPRPLGMRLLVAVILVLLPASAAALDGLLKSLFSDGNWRPMLLPMVVIYYIWIVSPIVDRGQAAVVAGFRPITQLDDETFAQIVAKAGHTSPLGEGLALLIGAAAGIFIGSTGVQGPDIFWLRWYWLAANALMFALLGWTIFGSIHSTRLSAVLQRQPLHFDLFDLHPFEPIGRQSLVLALVFIGGLVLAMLFGLSAENIRMWQTWLFYIPLALMAVLLFFLNMRGTHAVLAGEKRRLLSLVSARIRQITPSLEQSVVSNQPLPEQAAEFSTLSAYEARLNSARTWPYNTSMLRTLAFTILLPLVIRLITLLLFEN